VSQAAAAATQKLYDLATRGLVQGPSGLVLSDTALQGMAKTLAASDGEERLDGLVGVLGALEFAQAQEHAQGAAASLLAVVLTVLEKTQLSAAQRDAFSARLKQVTGGSAATKVLGGARPEGTIPAGPGARFAALDKRK
jgi:hypothetical protein